MNSKTVTRSPLAGLVLSACAAALIAAVAPQSAMAAPAPATAAGAKIFNQVTVTYFDANGANQHQAGTSSSVLVALKQAPLTVATAITFPAVDSGSTTTSYIALTANANGKDEYTVAITPTATNLTDPAGHTVTTNIFTDTSGGTSSAFNPSSTFLGATSIVSVANDVPGSTQILSVPAGTVSASGIVIGSVVVINGNSYKVTAVYDGVQAAYQTGAQTTLDLTGNAKTETLGTITIGKDATNTAPALATGGSLIGTLVAERKYLMITDTANVSSNTADGKEDFAVSTNTKTNSNIAALPAVDSAVFYFTQLSINKSVANVGAGTAKPGDLLEYTLTVTNTAPNGSAGKVSILDAVPAYTTLVSGTTYGAGGGTGTAGEVFATINLGASTVPITLDPTDTEPTGAGVGFGGTASNKVIAGTPINFYLGTGSSNSTGGTVAHGAVYTIKYQVKIN